MTVCMLIVMCSLSFLSGTLQKLALVESSMRSSSTRTSCGRFDARRSHLRNLPGRLIVHDAGIIDEDADFKSLNLWPNGIVYFEAFGEIGDDDLGFHFVGSFCRVKRERARCGTFSKKFQSESVRLRPRTLERSTHRVPV